MKHEKLQQTIAAFGCALILTCGLANFAQAQQTGQNDKLTADIDKAIRAVYDSFVKCDAAVFDNLVSADGFLYDSYGYVSAAELKKEMTEFFQSPQAAKSKMSYEFKDLKVVSANADTAIANYEMIRRTENEKGEKREYREQVTDVFTRRDARWLLFAEHISTLPKIVPAVSAGMPTGWRITPEDSKAENYRFTVDNQTKHGGAASALISGMCAANETDWASLAQSIAADEYRGKRVRLTGWLKTDGANNAGLWMRVDGNRHTLGFDNMDDRAVTGTTDWKQYEVVLDVPAEAVNLYFGTLVQGAGNVRADDFKLEVVGNDVAVTNRNTAEDAKRDNGRDSKPEANKNPVNLDFEAGAVQKSN